MFVLVCLGLPENHLSGYTLTDVLWCFQALSDSEFVGFMLGNEGARSRGLGFRAFRFSFQGCCFVLRIEGARLARILGLGFRV